MPRRTGVFCEIVPRAAAKVRHDGTTLYLNVVEETYAIEK
jgi:hypothetical protein